MNTHITEPTPMAFSIIGCGRVGTHLAVFLEKSGFVPASFSSRSLTSAQGTCRTVGKGVVVPAVEDAAKMADMIFLATPDMEIESVCETIAAKGGFSSHHKVFHLSGALGSDILSSAKKAGAATGSIHPLQAFVPYQEGQDSPFTGIHMGIEGDETAVCLGEKIVTALGGTSFVMPTSAKVLYHAAAVTASNYLVTLVHASLQMMQQTGLDAFQAYHLLEPLIQGSLENIKTKGTVKGLTGPISRGDFPIIEGHLKNMEAQLPELVELYRILGHYTLELARQGKGLDEKDGQILARLLLRK
ncbi:MAG: NADP oxidoreductase [Desulfobulbus propionicus]|nr:MAG: NADP oxidoreductase [Desulfobulbus propionicus]